MTAIDDIKAALDELGPTPKIATVSAIRCSPLTARQIGDSFTSEAPDVARPWPALVAIEIITDVWFPDGLALLFGSDGSVVGYLDGSGLHWVDDPGSLLNLKEFVI